MTPVDDLSTGDWVAIVEDTGYVPRWDGRDQPHYDGIPGRILAISLPFACVDVDGQIRGVDLRRMRVQKVNRGYAKAMRLAEPPKKRRKEKRDPRDCPRCGTRMVQVLDQANRVWRTVCPTCGFDKGLVTPLRS